MKESLLINQETAIEAINNQILLLKDFAKSISDQFFDERNRANKNKRSNRHYVQPRLREGDGSFTLHWVRYVPPIKGKTQNVLKSSHISKGKVNKYRYANGNLKRACHDNEEYERVIRFEDEFENIRKSLVFLVESRKYLALHRKNIDFLEKNNDI